MIDNIDIFQNNNNEMNKIKEKDIKSNEQKNILLNLINEIIMGTFISKGNSNDVKCIIKTNYFDFIQYYTYNQNNGSLCGFHSLFNIYYFLQYLTSKDNMTKNNYLFHLKNAWSFWSFYKESINFLLANLPLEIKAKESLIKGGPLERYQFVYLLKEFPKIKNLFNDINNNYIISFTKFLYGFGIFNGTIDEAMDFQDKMNKFMEPNTQDKEKILIILLGIVNHWTILILHKNNNNNNNIDIYYLDSRNSPEIFKSLELFDKQSNDSKTKIEKNKEIYIQKEIDKKNKKMSNWCITCLEEWYDSINKSIIIIFKILKNKMNLLNYIIDNKIKMLINSFISKTNIDLNNIENGIKISTSINNYIDKILSWIKEEYHPAFFKDNILYDINKTMIKYKEKVLINWIKIMEIFLNKEKENKSLEEDKKNIILRYIDEINQLKNLNNL